MLKLKKKPANADAPPLQGITADSNILRRLWLGTMTIILSILLLEFPETVNTPEIRLEADDLTKFKTVDNIAKKGDFAPGKLNSLDGIRVDYEDGLGLVRASNTMPALTLRFEANDADGLMRIQEQFRQQLTAHAANISINF